MTERNRYSDRATDEAEFSELVVERLASDVDLARDHATGRNRRVGQLLCMLGLMRAHGLIPPNTRCRVVGAELQDFSASAGNEAAHYMPGQLKLRLPGKGEVDPWSLLARIGARDAMAQLFSRPQNLPANFNKADSYAEKYAKPALKALLAQACQTVVDAAPPASKRLNVAAARAAYREWIAQSVLAYRAAINRKIDIAELDDLPPATAPEGSEPHSLNRDLPDLMERAVRKSASGKPGATVWDYSEQTRILGHYLRASEGSTLSERLIADVQAEFEP